VLGHAQDAEDAAQATFLVLARKAGSIRSRTSLSSWLYGVAYRIARKAKTAKARGPVRSGDLGETLQGERTPEWVWQRLEGLFDEEVNRLPERFRRPFVLSLEGKSNEEVARELGCPVGTVLSRLSRARSRLLAGLNRRGFLLSTGLLAATLAKYATAAGAAPAGFAGPMTRAALCYAARRAPPPGPVSARAVTLADRFLRSGFRWKAAVAAGGLAALLTGVALFLLLVGLPGSAPRPEPAPAPAAPPEPDGKRFAGNWRVVSVEFQGRQIPAGDQEMAFGRRRLHLVAGPGQGPRHDLRLRPDQATQDDRLPVRQEPDRPRHLCL
jgi:RNA polymerase sigma-70 factor (ECF subfamily)